MSIFAFYVPKPQELTEMVSILTIAYLVLCVWAYRLKLLVPLAAALMAVGCAVAIGPDIASAVHSDFAYGYTAREMSKTNYSDAFFAITDYMFARGGTQRAFAGMSVAIVSYAAVVAVRQRWKRKAVSD